MNISFANSALAIFLVLSAIPLLLHLFSRTKPPKFYFSSVIFIREIMKKNRRIKQPRNILLLVLRTLLFLFLILVFLKPLLFTHSGFSGDAITRSAVIIVDATASMGYIEGSQTRFARACAEASEIIADLSAGDTANIIWMRSPCKPVLNVIGKNLKFLKKELHKAGVTSEQGSIQEALDIATDMLKETEGSREIYIISDFQRSSWLNSDLSTPEGISLVTIKVGSHQAVNTAITGIYTEPRIPLKKEPVNIYAEVMNYSGQSQRMRVYLKADKVHQTQMVSLNPWSKASVNFRCKFEKEGEIPVSIHTDEDNFPEDNKRLTILTIKPYLRAGILAGEEETARYWKQALSSLGWIRSKYITASELSDLKRYDLVMLSGWKGNQSESLRSYLEKGGTIFVYPEHGLFLGSMAGLVDQTLSSDFQNEQISWQTLQDPIPLHLASPKDKVFEIFSEGEFGDPANGIFHERFLIPSSGKLGGDVLMAFKDGVPALVRYALHGTLFLWNLPLQEHASSWAGQVEFLPLLAELVIDAGSNESPDMTSDYLTGESLACNIPDGPMAESISLATHQGVPVSVHKKLTENGVNFVSEPIEGPGLYTWKRRNTDFLYNAVNFPTQESDLRTMTPKEIKRRNLYNINSGYQVRNLHDGLSLWPFLLATVLFLLVLESFVGWKFRNL